METVSSNAKKAEHGLNCWNCGRKLELQPILQTNARGELRQTLVYRCPQCSLLILHPHPTAAEAAAWMRMHH
jgi:DNA-directed RNA polymerase subunit RPC12/RpoP